MAVITFHNTETKETGQTLSVAAIATHMAIEHNYKILVISTSFNDLTLENCFWEYDKIRPMGVIKTGEKSVGLESGVEGLIKVLASNITSSEIVKNYTRIVLRDRLDILLSPKTQSYQESATLTQYYQDILNAAKRYYDLIFVDLSKNVPKQNAANILQESDIVVVNLTQRLRTINNFAELREANDFYKRKNVMLLIGKYDPFSKYTSKNISRYLKEKKGVSSIPYNTLFFEASSEGTIIDFFLKIRSITDENDRNMNFLKAVKEVDANIIFKLQELQMKI